ncbi:hypothetical protein YC2023_120002 [Brassica napus]
MLNKKKKKAVQEYSRSKALNCYMLISEDKAQITNMKKKRERDRETHNLSTSGQHTKDTHKRTSEKW